nr:immunoglobulin heavy chain junction region [Mus musculus]
RFTISRDNSQNIL